MGSDKKLGAGGASYAALAVVVLVWGISPVFNYHIYSHFSPSICTAMNALVSAVALFVISAKHIGLINREFLKIAIPTGLFNSAASLLQKIGLLYTTPSSYAFLENLSSVVVPILMFIFSRKKPGAVKILASVTCLVGCFVLSGIDPIRGGISLGIGEILCSLAGILYGFNIAATGAFARKLYAPLYIFVHMCVHFVISFSVAIALNFITVGGVPIEPLRFSWDISILLAAIFMALISNVLCWVLRTNAMKSVDATVVAVVMPLSAVVTGVISVVTGTEEMTPSLAIGGAICLFAAIISGLADVRKRDTGSRLPKKDAPESSEVLAKTKNK